MVNNPLIRSYFLGGVGIGGIPLDCHSILWHWTMNFGVSPFASTHTKTLRLGDGKKNTMWNSMNCCNSWLLKVHYNSWYDFYSYQEGWQIWIPSAVGIGLTVWDPYFPGRRIQWWLQGQVMRTDSTNGFQGEKSTVDFFRNPAVVNWDV